MAKKTIIITIFTLAIIATMVITMALTSRPEVLTECDMYLALEGAKSIFGGYVPDSCKR